MPKSPEDVKPESWHRYFGASANNRAWDLAECERTQIDIDELLDAAHAAAWHWKVIGNELNRMRALMLLAQAHAVAGLSESAVRYANAMRTYFLSNANTPDWELAFTHVVHAYAMSAAQLHDAHAASYAAATRAVESIKDDEDRKIVERVFRHVPRPRD
jgi:hypothetical protein